MTETRIPPDSVPGAPGVSGLVLAGGRARRMHGRDKGLLELHGRTLVARALARLAPQTDELLISANRNLARYRCYGRPVIVDGAKHGENPGPLAGILAGMRAARHARLLVAPCDAPLLPVDLGRRLALGLTTSGLPCARVCSGGRVHPVFMLVERRLAHALDAFLAAGGRAVGDWQSSIGVVDVAFDDADQMAFAPLNTPEALAALACAPDRIDD